MKIKQLAATAMLAAGLTSSAQAAPVDIAFIVDQSVSMGGEFNWLPTVISDIDSALQSEAAVDSVRYGVVGYMESPQTRDNGTPLVYQDLTGSVTDVVNQVSPRPPLYAFQESGYEAAYWSQTGFSWDNNAAKIMILLTDETGDQRSDLGPGAPAPGGNGANDATREAREAWLGNELDGNGFLLNVITTTSLFSRWDDAVFDINDPSYSGLFSLNDLRSDPTGFTQTFVAAKVQEIIDNLPPDPDPDPNPVPESGTLALLGLSALLLLRRRMQA